MEKLARIYFLKSIFKGYMKKQTIIKGTIILTVAGLITRLLGFANRIYLSNLIGAEGMGLYQLVFPIYMVCYTICCSGLFTAVSRLTAEEKGKVNSPNVHKPMLIVTLISTTISIMLMILLYINADLLSIKLINEPRISLGLKIVALTLPFTAITHCIKGYYYGLNKPLIPATTQVLEQIVRISVIYILSSFFISKGLDYACAMAVIGMALGEVASCTILILSYTTNIKKATVKASKKYNYFIKKVTSISLPITTNRLITTLLVSIETILIPTKLQAYGYSHSYALSIYGTLTGMALPLIFFPTIVTNSASLMLLPAIANANARNNKSMIKLTVTKTLKYTIIMGIISTFLFIAFGKDLGTIIYNEKYVGTLLVTLGWLCPFLYLQITLGSILNGLDKQLITFRNNIIGLGVRIIFIYTLIPKYGLNGYLWGLLAGYLIVSALDAYYLIKVIIIPFNVTDFIIKPIIVCGASLSMVNLLNRLYHLPFSYTINTLILVFMYCIILLPLLIITKCITLNELKKLR
jgi:stage V sporulation protein B